MQGVQKRSELAPWWSCGPTFYDQDSIGTRLVHNCSHQRIGRFVENNVKAVYMGNIPREILRSCRYPANPGSHYLAKLQAGKQECSAGIVNTGRTDLLPRIGWDEVAQNPMVQQLSDA